MDFCSIPVSTIMTTQAYTTATKGINEMVDAYRHSISMIADSHFNRGATNEEVRKGIKRIQKRHYRGVKDAIKDWQPQLWDLKKEVKRGIGGEWREFSQFCSFKMKFVDCLLQVHAYLYNRKHSDDETIKKFKELFLLQDLITTANRILSPQFDDQDNPFMEMMSDLMENCCMFYRDIIISKGEVEVSEDEECVEVSCELFRFP